MENNHHWTSGTLSEKPIPGWWLTYPSETYEFVSLDDEMEKRNSCSKPPTGYCIIYYYDTIIIRTNMFPATQMILASAELWSCWCRPGTKCGDVHCHNSGIRCAAKLCDWTNQVRGLVELQSCGFCLGHHGKPRLFSWHLVASTTLSGTTVFRWYCAHFMVEPVPRWRRKSQVEHQATPPSTEVTAASVSSSDPIVKPVCKLGLERGDMFWGGCSWGFQPPGYNWYNLYTAGYIFTGWWLTYPSEKYESQLGWWNSKYMEK